MTTTVQISNEDASRIFQALYLEAKRLSDAGPHKVGQDAIDHVNGLTERFRQMRVVDSEES